VDGLPHTTATYARQPLRLARQVGALLAHGGRLAYRVAPTGHITVAAADPGLVVASGSPSGVDHACYRADLRVCSLLLSPSSTLGLSKVLGTLLEVPFVAW
jgi:hypothetical protein